MPCLKSKGKPEMKLKIKPQIFLFILIMIQWFSCKTNTEMNSLQEPADPDTYDMLVWEKIEPGLHSGFGSTDLAYSKSLPPEGNISGSRKLQGWKGERVSCKLLVWSNESTGTIRIKTKGLSNKDYKIADENISISIVKYVLTDQFLNEKGGACGPRDNNKIPVHLAPDLLSNDNIFSIEDKGTRPVWIAVNIPVEAPAGRYSGKIHITSKS